VAGRTIMMITHELEVAAHAKRVVRLSDGRLVSDLRNTGLAELPPRFVPGDLSGEPARRVPEATAATLRPSEALG